MTARPPTALVTGASSGLGAAISQALAARGWYVLAASRSGSAEAGAGGLIQPIALDVARERAVQDAVEATERRGLPIDLLVANAGVHACGMVEETPVGFGRQVLDTNFWGVVHAVRAVLPGMRRRRRGTLAVTGSLAGLVASPAQAYYAASKHALEGFLEALWYEVAPFGVAVKLAEPGCIQTRLAADSPEIPGSIDDYAGMREGLREQWKQAIARGDAPERMAERMVEWFLHGKGLRQRFGTDARWVPRWKQALPQQMFLAVARRKFGLAARGADAEEPAGAPRT